MRVAIAGAGAVGRSVAQALLTARHEVLLIERQRASFQPDLVPDAHWMLADACELSRLNVAGIETCDVVMAATGDDKANLVFALLAKTEFAVPRVVGRVNNPGNHWLFSRGWGVDVAVSTPGTLSAAVDGAVSIGDIVRLMTLQQSRGNILEITLAPRAAVAGRRIAELELPSGAALLTLVRGAEVIRPNGQTLLQPGDQILLVATAQSENRIRSLLAGER
jgi:trk system potassium uptake protein TrkA